MNRVRSSSGYTIVETMVFLGVSGALFFSAMLVVNGQQRKTEFATAVRDFDSKLQSIKSNVASGYYNSPGQFSCSDPGTGIPTITAASSTQGQNQDCTFIGQYIDLAPTNDKFTITSYAGLRRVGNPPLEVQNLSEANARPITLTAEDYALLSGITVSMKLIATGQVVRTIAITTSFSQYNGESLSSGSAKPDIHAINSGIGLDAVNPAAGIQICLTDGSQVGEIVLNTGTTRLTIGNACP